jgi:class II lanthipeptide synthase
MSAIEAVGEVSSKGYSWFARLGGQLPVRVRAQLSEHSIHEYVRISLTQQLYCDYYSCGYPRPVGPEASQAPMFLGVTPFMHALIDANMGNGPIERDWEVIENHTVDHKVIRRNGLNVWLRGEEQSAITSSRVAVGDRVDVKVPKHLLASSPGYYVALGNCSLGNQSSDGLLRIYWNIEAKSAASLVRLVTTQLNESNVPFYLKVLSEPSQYTRCDSGVLLLRRADFGVVSEKVLGRWAREKSARSPIVPALTKRLAPGIGVAEHPADGNSFGLDRCALIAGGLIEASALGVKTLAERVTFVENAFEGAGLRMDAPFLGPAGQDCYGALANTPIPTARGRGNRKGAVGSTYLDQAASIAVSISDEAVWHEGNCTWVGASLAQPDSDFIVRGITYSAFGPDLYNGTSGVALFLAEVAAATGDRDFARTATGAIRHALAFDLAKLEAGYWGLFTGWPGVALAGARIGALLDSDEVNSLTRDYIRVAKSRRVADTKLDMMSGCAGGVTALAAIHRYLPTVEVAGLALELGKVLVASAGDSGHSKGYQLTGMANGASGIGFALTELHRLTGDDRFRTGALRAFDGERKWFDLERERWRDPSRHRLRDKPSAKHGNPLTSWCYGTSGTAMSCLAAYKHFDDADCRSDAVAGFQVTRKAIGLALESGPEDFSLCHGLAGLAEALISACKHNLQENGGDGQLVHDVARLGIEKYSNERSSWPGGTAGKTPGLMLGLAGIGHFYLRLHQSQVSSPILVI